MKGGVDQDPPQGGVRLFVPGVLEWSFVVGVPGFWARHEVGYLGLESEFYRKASLRHTNVIIATIMAGEILLQR